MTCSPKKKKKEKNEQTKSSILSIYSFIKVCVSIWELQKQKQYDKGFIIGV